MRLLWVNAFLSPTTVIPKGNYTWNEVPDANPIIEGRVISRESKKVK